MKGYDYRTMKAVNWSIPQWRALAKEATRKGGFVHYHGKLGETFIHDNTGLIAEMYCTNHVLDKETNHAR